MPDESFSLRLYRWLVKLYPAGFRDNYAEPLERDFRDELNESTGGASLAILWIRLLLDLAVSLPLQISREVAQDSRHTLRLWARRPWYTGFAILALAIGIGANTGVFSVVNALLLRSLPFKDPGRLAVLQNFWFVPHDSPSVFHDWRQHSSYLADAAISEQKDVNLTANGGVRRVHAAQTSWNFFSLLGARPVLGRAFAPGEDTEGNNAVAVIGYGLWQGLFGGNYRVLGSTIRVDGFPLTIVGVAPPGFDYPGKTAIWKAASNVTRGNNGWETVARLKPGVSWPQARAAFAAEAGHLANRYWPNRTKLDRINFPPTIVPLQDALAGPVKKASLMLMACVALILLLACTNVANLLIARTTDRATELSIRSALGASRARLRQQLLTECMLLSLAACVAGLVVAFWTTSLAAKVQPAPIASQAYSILDGRVLGFSIGLAVLSGLLFGVLPSWYAGRVHTFRARGSTGSRGSRLLREALAAGQIMITIILVAGSVSLGRAFVKLMRTDRGFDVGGVVTVNVSLDGTTRGLAGRQLPYFEQVLARIRRLPGVRNASATDFLPLYATGFVGGPWTMNGRPAQHASMTVRILPDYFQTMGGHILCGREFTDAEVRTNAKVAVVNDVFAGEFDRPCESLDREIRSGDDAPRKIIGVVEAMDYMVAGANRSQVFLPSQTPGDFFSTFVARVDGRAEDHLAIVRGTVQSVDPRVPVFGVKSMRERLDDMLVRPRFYRTALLCFAAFALLLAVIGVYGIVSHAVAERTHEMGVRMALWITAARLRVSFLKQGFVTFAAGAIPGIAGAVLSGRLLQSLVDGAKPVNATTFTVSVLFIAFVAGTGIWMATRPIAQLDVVEILRTE